MLSPLPPFVDAPIDLSMPGPGELEQSTGYFFFVEAGAAQLQRLCDRLLNGPSGGAVQYRPAAPLAMLAFVDVGRLSSSDPRRGHIRYLDVAVWVPLERTHPGPAGERHPHAVRLLAPYIFVDNPIALVTGREVFGLPKQPGWGRMPSGPKAVDRLSCDVLGLPASGRQVRYRRHRLLEVSRVEGRPLLKGLPATALRGLGLSGPLLRSPNEMVVVGLKQVRDAADGDRARHQAVVETPMRLRRWRGGGWLPGRYELRVSPLASHPLVEELGLASDRVPVQAAAWARFDTRWDPGRELWSSHPVTPAAASSGPRRTTRPSPRPAAKTRVAVLGGGISSLAAALALSEPGTGDRYEITVYQPGWRLGGKGASGRNAAKGNRIEEHGLHVWYGFYDNAFALMRRCYQELGRPPEHPLATLEQAFLPQSYVVLNEQHQGRWRPWRMEFPRNDGRPGEGGIQPRLGPLLRLLMGWQAGIVRQLMRERRDGGGDREVRSVLKDDGGFVFRLAELLLKTSSPVLRGADRVSRAFAWLRRGGADGSRPRLALLRRYHRWLASAVAGSLDRDEVRMLWQLVDTLTAIVVGIVEDDLVTRGFGAIDHLDLRDWLISHGAQPETVASSPAVRFIYNAGFSFEAGDAARPNFAAGAALRGILRLMLDYKGSIIHKMNGGMGDVVFAPIYEVLRRRGVKFRFFHAVQNLGLSQDGTRIEHIDVTEEARLAGDEYHPLVDVGGVPCWPSAPLRDQLREGKRRLRLQHGRDFDQVVFGIPVGVVPGICPELLAHDRRWREMVERVKTVPTQSYQLWMKDDLRALGWKGPGAVVGTYVDPVDTYADMSHLVAAEGWPDGEVGSIAYFCGVMPDRAGETQAQADRRAERGAREHYRDRCSYFWPALVADESDADKDERLAGMYTQANVTGTDRYTPNFAGSGQYRLRPDDSGFNNLVLAGDWTDNGLNCGCIEAAVMSGLAAARALGAPVAEIVGETDDWLGRVTDDLRAPGSSQALADEICERTNQSGRRR